MSIRVPKCIITPIYHLTLAQAGKEYKYLKKVSSRSSLLILVTPTTLLKFNKKNKDVFIDYHLTYF
jgi:hypothetical protein